MVIDRCVVDEIHRNQQTENKVPRCSCWSPRIVATLNPSITGMIETWAADHRDDSVPDADVCHPESTGNA